MALSWFPKSIGSHKFGVNGLRPSLARLADDRFCCGILIWNLIEDRFPSALPDRVQITTKYQYWVCVRGFNWTIIVWCHRAEPHQRFKIDGKKSAILLSSSSRDEMRVGRWQSIDGVIFASKMILHSVSSSFRRCRVKQMIVTAAKFELKQYKS